MWMRAAVVTDRGTGKVEVVERDAPRPGAGQLLVRVRAAGVNPVDWKLRSGALGMALGRFAPEVPGMDLAGVVEEVGAGVDRFPAGAAVVGMTRRGGTYAELAVVDAGAAARLPEGVSFVDAAALPVAGLTALQALRDQARLAAGQRVLVNGAAGGVGTYAVQIARVLGARVTAVASARNLELAAELGAERTVDYRVDDFCRLPETWDVIFDTVANRSFRECAPRLAPTGAYVTTLPRAGAVVRRLLAPLLGGKRAFVTQVQASGADLEYLAGLLAAGRLRSVIDRALPLDQADEAFAASRGGHVRGKLVLTPSP